jgi:peroxiredoxin Q/BCP
VLGVSADDKNKQSNFKKKFNFPYELLCDVEKKIINSYGVWSLKKFMGREYMGILRTTFIIDEKGVITNIIDKVKTKHHTSQILD